MPWWIMPAITVGAMYLVKRKGTAGKFRWISLTKEDVGRVPIGLVMAQLQSGDELPEAPPMTTWKPMQVAIAPSPFAAVQEVTIHVLEKWVGVPEVAEPTDPINGAATDLGYFLTKEYLETAPVLGPGPRVGDLGVWRPRQVMHRGQPRRYQQIVGPSALPKHQRRYEWTAPSAAYRPGQAPMRRSPSVWASRGRPSVMPEWERFVHLFGMGGG